jgi:hypothetical protein
MRHVELAAPALSRAQLGARQYACYVRGGGLYHAGGSGLGTA